MVLQRLWLAAGLVVTTAVSVYVGLSFLHTGRFPRLPNALTSVKAPEPAARVAGGPPVVVDSGAAPYSLDLWNVPGGFAGWIDQAVFADGAPAASRAPTRGDVVELSGWAGDPQIGLRADYVIAAWCGAVIAAAPTGLARPDVGTAVHSNLAQSGWRMRLAVAHMSVCEDATLRVYGAFSQFGLAVSLREPLSLPPVDASVAAPVFAPAAALPQPLKSAGQGISARADTDLRRCAAEACDVSGRLPRGNRQVVVADKSGDWLLIVDTAAGIGGWIKSQAVSLSAPASK